MDRVRADRDRITPIVTSQETTEAAQIAANPTLDGFRNTGITVNEDINPTSMEQYHALSESVADEILEKTAYICSDIWCGADGM